jgi:hypothetical protein
MFPDKILGPFDQQKTLLRQEDFLRAPWFREQRDNDIPHRAKAIFPGKPRALQNQADAGLDPGRPAHDESYPVSPIDQLPDELRKQILLYLAIVDLIPHPIKEVDQLLKILRYRRLNPGKSNRLSMGRPWLMQLFRGRLHPRSCCFVAQANFQVP